MTETKSLSPRWIGAILPKNQLNGLMVLPNVLGDLDSSPLWNERLNSQGLTNEGVFQGFASLFADLFQTSWIKDSNVPLADQTNRYLELGTIDNCRTTVHVVSRDNMIGVGFKADLREEKKVMSRNLLLFPNAGQHVLLRAIDQLSVAMTTSLLYLMLRPQSERLHLESGSKTEPSNTNVTNSMYSVWMTVFASNYRSFESDMEGSSDDGRLAVRTSWYNSVQELIKRTGKNIMASNLSKETKSWAELMMHLASVSPVGRERVHFLLLVASLLTNVDQFNKGFGGSAAAQPPKPEAPKKGTSVNSKLKRAVKAGATQATTQVVLGKLSDQVLPAVGRLVPGIQSVPEARAAMNFVVPYLLAQALDLELLPKSKHEDKLRFVLAQAMEGSATALSGEAADRFAAYFEGMYQALTAEEDSAAPVEPVVVSSVLDELKERELETLFA
jgi:hypothetical protein